MRIFFILYLLLGGLLNNYRLLISIIFLMNLISFTIFYIDKRKAIKGKNRISENTLLLSAFLFGSIGAFLSMLIFRHKTKKLKFRILVPLFFVVRVLILYYLYKIMFSKTVKNNLKEVINLLPFFSEKIPLRKWN